MSDMFERLMQPPVTRAYRQPRRPAALEIQPDYQRLIEVLERLYHVPDGLGETVLTPEEAAAIRRCGFCGPHWDHMALPAADEQSPFFKPSTGKRRTTDSDFSTSVVLKKRA